MLLSFITPTIAHAEEINLSVKEIIFRISYNILNPLIQIGFAIALLYLVWKIVMYIRERNSGFIYDAKEKQWGGSNGITDILWGLFGLFIMTSAFVFMKIIATWIGVDANITKLLP
jgi:hypothetical protein